MSIYTVDPQQAPQACIFWLHGLGADASDMRELVERLPINSLTLRHVFIDAPQRPVTINNGMVMRAWYDISGFNQDAKEDKAGIAASEKIIRQAMHSQVGFPFEQMYLAGFSQGGAMALHTALHTPERLGGVIALSGYLPTHADCKPTLDKNTPFFLASGSQDPVVLPAWSQFADQWLKRIGYMDVTYREYPMQHTICYNEIQDMSQWLTQQIRGEF